MLWGLRYRRIPGFGRVVFSCSAWCWRPFLLWGLRDVTGVARFVLNRFRNIRACGCNDEQTITMVLAMIAQGLGLPTYDI